MNGLPNCIAAEDKVKIKLFADDSKLYSSDSRQLQNSLDKSITWTQNRQLKVASHKCFQLSITKKHSNTHTNTYTIGSSALENKSFVTDLGIIVNSNIKWAQHCDLIYKRASQTTYQIFKCFKSRNIWTLLHLYKTYVRPKVEFNSSVWSPYLKQDISRVEEVQKHFTRRAFLRCNIPFESYADRLNKVNLKTLEKRRLVTDLVLLYQIINGLSDLRFSDFYFFNHNPYNLRRNSIQIFPLRDHLNAQWRHSFFIRTARVWNSLPEEIVTVPSTDIFKRHVSNLDLSVFLTF